MPKEPGMLSEEEIREWQAESRALRDAPTQWLIWSNEHRAWWRPASAGYTTKRSDAGVYSLAEAISVCLPGRFRWGGHEDVPPETMIPADVSEIAKQP